MASFGLREEEEADLSSSRAEMVANIVRFERATKTVAGRSGSAASHFSNFNLTETRPLERESVHHDSDDKNLDRKSYFLLLSPSATQYPAGPLCWQFVSHLKDAGKQTHYKWRPFQLGSRDARVCIRVTVVCGSFLFFSSGHNQASTTEPSGPR